MGKKPRARTKPKAKAKAKKRSARKAREVEEITQPMPVLEPAMSSFEPTQQLPTHAVVDEIEEKMIVDEIDDLSRR